VDVTVAAAGAALMIEQLGIDLDALGVGAAILVPRSGLDVEVDRSGYVLMAAPVETGGGPGHQHDDPDLPGEG
jgi:hypothetical protein